MTNNASIAYLMTDFFAFAPLNEALRLCRLAAAMMSLMFDYSGAAALRQRASAYVVHAAHVIFLELPHVFSFLKLHVRIASLIAL
jgi:hypothetical protein